MDFQRYLERINYTGSRRATAVTLRDLHLAHLQSVPFENLDIHLGNAIVLDVDALYEKMVVRRRGGFCYEQNGLFAWLLRELGFEVTLLSARVATEDGGFGEEFDHLTLQVRCPVDRHAPAATWLADVGFGDSFNLPLPLDKAGETEQEGMRAYRIEQMDGERILWQRGYDGTWEKQYRFSLQPRMLADFDLMCRHHQTSPLSHFTQRRVCSMATENGRVTLGKKGLIITESGARREQPVDQDAYRGILKSQFGVILD